MHTLGRATAPVRDAAPQPSALLGAGCRAAAAARDGVCGMRKMMNGERTSGNIPPSLLPSLPRTSLPVQPVANSGVSSAPPTSHAIGGWVPGGVASLPGIATCGRCVFKRRHTCVLFHNCIKMSQPLLTLRSFVCFRRYCNENGNFYVDLNTSFSEIT